MVKYVTTCRLQLGTMIMMILQISCPIPLLLQLRTLAFPRPPPHPPCAPSCLCPCSSYRPAIEGAARCCSAVLSRRGARPALLPLDGADALAILRSFADEVVVQELRVRARRASLQLWLTALEVRVPGYAPDPLHFLWRMTRFTECVQPTLQICNNCCCSSPCCWLNVECCR